MEVDSNVTELLKRWRAGDLASREELFNVAYGQLKKIARGVLEGDRQRFAIQPTELVNECSLRLLGLNQISWQDRAHFMAVVTTTMRRVLIDQARRKQAEKREGLEVTLMTHHLAGTSEELDIERIDQAITRLESISEDKAKIVELKFFGGLTNEEIAEVMQFSESTVKRKWRVARAWLYAELKES